MTYRFVYSESSSKKQECSVSCNREFILIFMSGLNRMLETSGKPILRESKPIPRVLLNR